jgi:hypothetical protein
MKYLIIGHRFGALGRGGYHISKRFCDEHKEYCEFKDDRKFLKLEDLNDRYKRLIFRTQVPRCYNQQVNFVKLRKINHLFYLRAKFLNPLYENCTNGFYYFKEHKGYDRYIPMITDFPVQENYPKQETWGFYVRKWLTPDSFDCFIDILNNFKRFKVNVTIMGDPSPEIENHPNVLHYNHTNDNVQFFSEITHYFYPTSRYFVDPFPHSVLEAVQTGKTIIFPKIERTHKDGIDDLKDIIHWHENYYPMTDNLNKDQPLTASNFKNFYKKVFDCDWNYKISMNRYKNLYEWIQGEVL